MSKVSAKHYLIKLKTILQSKQFFLIISLICVFYCLLIFYLGSNKSKYKGTENKIEATILNIKYQDLKITLTLQGKEKIMGIYYLKSEEEKMKILPNLKLGEKIFITGIMQKPKRNTIPNTFNYQKYLSHQKIYYLFKIKSFKITDTKINLLLKLKNSLISYLNQKENSDYLKAFILGDKTQIDKDVWKSYQKNGITHLFAISGMHISLFVLILTKLFKLIHLNNKIAFGFLLLFLLFYLFLTNFTASILRAGVFFIFLTLNKKCKFNLSTFKVLYLTIIFLLFLNPYLIFNLGFLYSSLATLGLIFGSNILTVKNYFGKVFLTSFIALIFTLPLTLYNFYEINLLSLIMNILFVPFVSLILYPLILLDLFIPIDLILHLLIKLMELLSQNLSIINLNIIIPKINFIFIIIYYFIVLKIIIGKKYKLTIILITLLVFWKIIPYFDFSDYVYFLDVGQGDSILIKKENKIIMIDTGGKENFLNNNDEDSYHVSDNIMTFLKSLGRNKIDILILTHGDFDHMGESIYLTNNFKIGKVIFNCGEFNDMENDLKQLVTKKKIPYYSCINNLKIAKTNFSFLHTQSYDNENDNSSVIYTKFHNYKLLFMGDASSKVENNLLKKYNLENIDILKVGHHGSKTSSSKEFIKMINPQYAIISVGKNNIYHHPNDEVLDNLKQSKILRTDQKGSICFKIKKKKLKITFYPP